MPIISDRKRYILMCSPSKFEAEKVMERWIKHRISWRPACRLFNLNKSKCFSVQLGISILWDYITFLNVLNWNLKLFLNFKETMLILTLKTNVSPKNLNHPKMLTQKHFLKNFLINFLAISGKLEHFLFFEEKL